MSQARILVRVATFYSKGSSRPKVWTRVSCVSCIGRRVLHWHTTWNPCQTPPGNCKCSVAPSSLTRWGPSIQEEGKRPVTYSPLPQLSKTKPVGWGYSMCILIRRVVDHLHLFPVCTARNRQRPTCRVLRRLVLEHLGWLRLPCHKNALQGEYPITEVISQDSFLVKVKIITIYMFGKFILPFKFHLKISLTERKNSSFN